MRRFVLLLMFVVAGCRKDEAAEAAPASDAGAAVEPTMPEVGLPAPAFALTDTDGTLLDLQQACERGPVVLVFGSFT
jgi:hypothetical protein